MLVCYGDRRPYADLYAFNLQDIIPPFPIPNKKQIIKVLLSITAML
ncbi:DUF4058 family protein [Nostoc sp.]